MASSPSKPMSVQELIEAKTIFEKDLEVLTQSFGQLKDAQERLATNISSLHFWEEAEGGQELMVPLSASVSVLGRVHQQERVTVDVGTGYFVEMSVKDAVGYYGRKVEFLQQQLGSIEKLMGEKRGQLGLVMQALSQLVSSQ